MSFARVYPCYVAKAQKKGRSKEEVDQILTWLTGYNQSQIDEILVTGSDIETFFPMRLE